MLGLDLDVQILQHCAPIHSSWRDLHTKGRVFEHSWNVEGMLVAGICPLLPQFQVILGPR
jgi:hypothetical protein